jgi:hypothetical protein
VHLELVQAGLVRDESDGRRILPEDLAVTIEDVVAVDQPVVIVVDQVGADLLKLAVV